MKALPIEARRLYPTIGIFGMSGGGKTSLAATSDRPVFIDSNGGMLSVADVPEFKHLRRLEMKNMQTLDRLYDHFTGTRGDWRKHYGTAVFDHFDDIQQIILGELADRASQNREEPDQIEQREYGIMANKLRRYLRKMKALPVTKILIMGERFDEQQNCMWPSLIGQLRDQIPYWLDHCIYLRVNDKGTRYVHLDPKPNEFYAKTRARYLAPQFRKVKFELSNTRLLTDLLAEIAKGPSVSKAQARERDSK